jgi:aminopeptidase N
MNTLIPEIEISRTAASRASTIAQSAAPTHPTLRSHHVSVGLYRLEQGTPGPLPAQVDSDVRGERTDVDELRGEPLPDLALVNDDDLTFAKLRFDPDLAAHRARTTSAASSRPARALALLGGALGHDPRRRAAHPRLRRGGAPPRQGRGPRSPCSSGCSARRWRPSTSSATRPTATAARARVAGIAWEQLAAAEPGGDVQLTWARAHLAAGDCR